MMRTKTKIEIRVEKVQRTTIRLRHPVVAWCVKCAAEGLMLTPGEAALLAQTTARTIFRSVEAGEVHFLETEDGALLICRNSIVNGLTITNPGSTNGP